MWTNIVTIKNELIIQSNGVAIIEAIITARPNVQKVIISSYLQRYENNTWVPVKNWSGEIHGKKFYFDWISGVPDTASARTWDQQLLRWGNEHQTNTPRTYLGWGTAIDF